MPAEEEPEEAENAGWDQAGYIGGGGEDEGSEQAAQALRHPEQSGGEAEPRGPEQPSS